MKSVQGQGLVEYLILVCLIAVSTIAIVSVVGKNIQESYWNISAALRGKEGERVTPTKPDKSTYEQRGMSDFMEGARKPAGGN